MNLDVCILAGGHGTRLAGLWDKAKCLVPIGPEGTPLLKLLLDEVLSLNPRRVFLLLGVDHRAEEVVEFAEKEYPELIRRFVLVPHLSAPSGTADALRGVARDLREPVLVLNGDTLPLYKLFDFVDSKLSLRMLPSAAWCDGVYAGAALLDEWTLWFISKNADKLDLDYYIPFLHRCWMPKGFIDIGTPESFYRAAILQFPSFVVNKRSIDP